MKSSLKFKDTRLPSRRRISLNLISDAIHISKRDKDPSGERRLNIIKNSQRNQSTASKSLKKQISTKSSEKIFNPNKSSKTKTTASVNKKLKNA